MGTKLILAVVFCLCTLQLKCWGQTSSIDRTDLFKRGYTSLAFFSMQAIRDEGFRKDLTNDELEMLTKIGAIAQEVTTINWLQKNKAQRYTTPTGYVWAYTVADNKVTQITTAIDRPLQILFSNDQRLFTLSATEPVRSAMTETAIEKDIFINLAKINDPNNSLDLAGAVALLLHEFGHKLGVEKKQDALNSAATKLESYIRSQTKTLEFEGKKFNTLHFDPKFFRGWLEDILVGEFVGLNKPRKITALTSIDGQGLYVWIDDGLKIKDLTPDLLSNLLQQQLLEFNPVPEFQFLKQTAFLASRVQIQPGLNGRVKVLLNASLAQLILPFMKTGSFEPKQFQLMQKAFPNNEPWAEVVNGYEFSIKSKTGSVEKPKIAIPTFQLPQIKVEFLEKRVRNNQLEIFFHIPGDRRFVRVPHTEQKYFWPQITIEIDGHPLTITAQKFYPESEEFKFVLDNYAAVSNMPIKITAAHFILTDENLADKNSNLVTKLFLPAEVPLTPIPITTISAAEVDPVLKSVQVWNGQSWIPLKKKTQVALGTKLRFVFQSTERLRQLSIDQNYETQIHATEVINNKVAAKKFIRNSADRRVIQFNQAEMQQEFRSEMLYVDLAVDKNILSQFTGVVDQQTDDYFRETNGSTLYRVAGTKSLIDFKSKPERRLNAVSFVTVSGRLTTIELKNSLIFFKSDKPEKLTCQGLF